MYSPTTSSSTTSQQPPQHYHQDLAHSPLPVGGQLQHYQLFPQHANFANHQAQQQQFIPPAPQLNRRASAPNFNLANNPANHYKPQQPMTSFFVMPEGGSSQTSSKAPRRRRSAAGSEPVKHRRTRSGCFTCRTRRVKCDETHPICERCQKGGRECTYPDVVPSSSKSASGSQRRRDKSTASREGSSSLEDVEEEEEEEDGDYGDAQSPRENMHAVKRRASASVLRASVRRESWPSGSEQSDRRRSRARKQSSTDQSPSANEQESSAPTSPAESHGLRRTASRQILSPLSPTIADWSHLPHDVAFYLNYHSQFLTCHHYFQKHDTGFFKISLFDYALQNEALLYAVAAFSSFHYSVHFKTGAFQTFLEYYNKSVALLRVSLDPECERNTSTIITILQLASFEEYLGDWMSLMEHRNAASQLLTSLWTPESMAQSEENRTIYNWFLHFDVLASMMAGHNTALSNEWSEANLRAITQIHHNDTDDVGAKIYLAMCSFQDLAVEASIMSARRSANQITLEEFVQESQATLRRCQAWWENLEDSVLYAAQTVSPRKYINSDDTDDEEICPVDPAPLYTGDCWGVNFLLCDYHGLLILLNHQLALTNNPDHKVSLADTKTLADNALRICEVIAAMEAYPDTPAGSILAAQAPIGLAALWIPREYRGWMQRQLANCEQMGFVFPLAFRIRMAELWDDPSLKHTWVSSSSETPIGLTIRRLVDMRDSEMPGDSARQDIKQMRSLMKEMRLDSKGSGQLAEGSSPIEPPEPQQQQQQQQQQW